MEKHVSLLVKGKVQAVGFRHQTQKKAFELGVKGFVKNEYDGTVYIEVSGPSVQIEQFVNWCYKGPSYAEVDDVLVLKNKEKYFSNFSIL